MSLITTYKRLPVSFTHGKGVYLYDAEGNAYLDGYCGVAVTGLGHTHPAVTAAICEQAAQVIHTSNAYQIPLQEELAQRLVDITGMEQAFFGNSGAEANEAAIKITRLYGHQRGIETPEIIVMEKAFHGRTMATLTAGGSRPSQAGFEPLVPGFVRAPFNDIEAVRTIAKNRDDIVAIMVEPVQGESGVNVPDSDYLTKLRQICDEHEWLLILDEVQTGNGRMGHWYAYQAENILPDVMTTAKGLANGIPIGVCLMRGLAKDLLLPGKHGSTFGGNPLACASALAVLNTIENDDLLKQVLTNSAYLMQKLVENFGQASYVKEIRGRGLMIGIEFDRDCTELKNIGLKHRVLFGTTATSVLRLLPPLIISKKEIDELVKRLGACFNDFF